jgi:hypothetical protein
MSVLYSNHKFTFQKPTKANKTLANKDHSEPADPSKPHLEPIATVSPHGKHFHYALATKNKPAINIESIISLLTKLLSDISTTDNPKSIICSTTTSFLNILLNSHE